MGDNWIRVYLTLRCNQQCTFCVHRQNLKEFAGHAYQELSPRAWVRIFKRVKLSIILTGGEPFLYPGLIELVQRSPERQIRIYTNLTLDVSEFAQQVKRKVSLLISYHPLVQSFDRFRQQFELLQVRPNFHGVVHVVDVPEHQAAIVQARKLFANGIENWKFTIVEDQRRQNPEMSSKKVCKRVRCRRVSALVAPDGVRYPCASLLLRRKQPQEDLKKQFLRRGALIVECNDYGHCCPCDAVAPGSVYPHENTVRQASQ